jgi:lactate dehydrogenase-like 2-hydroxyacid dehydrogenase
MNHACAVALQLCPFSPPLEQSIRERFAVVRWFELPDHARAAFLRDEAASVRAIVTGGHLGCPAELMRRLPRLGVIAVNGVGVDKVDLALARERGVAVGNTPGVLTEDVADLAVGLVISLLRGIPQGDAHVRSGAWPGGDRPLARKVTGRRFGIVGLGRIGHAIAQRLAPFGPVAYTGPAPKPGGFEYYTDVLSLARAADVLVLACPANDATTHLVDAAVLDALGPDGYLVNVARGSVVDEAALVAALDAGRVAGAALDVFASEPHVPETLRQRENTVLTPHVASATVETRAKMAELVLANLDAYLAGTALPTAV